MQNFYQQLQLSGIYYMKTNTIDLKLDIAEINLIIKALSERPFREVYELIGRIHAQSSNQLKPNELSGA